MAGAISGSLSGGVAGSLSVSGATLASIFGSKLVESWDAADSARISTVGGEVDTWTGQVRGVVLSAAAAANRCQLNAADANFNNQPTVQGNIAGTNYLRATGIAPALLTTGDQPCVFVVGRFTSAAGGSQSLFSMGGATRFDTVWICNTVAGSQRGRVVSSTPANLNIDLAVVETSASLTRLQYEVAANGMVHRRNAVQGVLTPVVGIVEDISTVGFSGSPTGTFLGDGVAALIVVLNRIPTAGEISAFESYCTSRFGVP